MQGPEGHVKNAEYLPPHRQNGFDFAAYPMPLLYSCHVCVCSPYEVHIFGAISDSQNRATDRLGHDEVLHEHRFI